MNYVCGLDLGQQADYSALAVLELELRPRADDPRRRETVYRVVELKRWPLLTPYTEIVRKVAEWFAVAPLRNAALAVDQTGVGRPVVEMFRQARVQAVLRPVTITAGFSVVETGPPEMGYHVPKRELVATVQTLMGARPTRLPVEPVEDVDVLVCELKAFTVRVTKANNETFSAREGEHDDLCLAVALAAWVGERSCPGWDGGLGGKKGERPSAVLNAPRGVFLPGAMPKRW